MGRIRNISWCFKFYLLQDGCIYMYINDKAHHFHQDSTSFWSAVYGLGQSTRPSRTGCIRGAEFVSWCHPSVILNFDEEPAHDMELWHSLGP